MNSNELGIKLSDSLASVMQATLNFLSLLTVQSKPVMDEANEVIKEIDI